MTKVKIKDLLYSEYLVKKDVKTGKISKIVFPNNVRVGINECDETTLDVTGPINQLCGDSTSTFAGNLIVQGTLTANINVSGSGDVDWTDNGGNLSTTSSLNVENTAYFTGPVTSSMGFSGSLQRLTDNTSYLVAGSNVTITSASNGSITIASTGGSSYPVVVTDIDYSAESNNTAPGDGTISLGGVNHVIQNSAASSQFDIVNGVGIRIRYQTAGGGVSFDVTNDAPGIWVYLRDIISGHSEMHRYLFMWHIDVRAAGITFDNAADYTCFYLQKLANLGAIDTFYEEQTGAYDAAGVTRLYSATASNSIAWGASEQTTTQRLRTEMDTTNANNSAVDNVVALKHVSGHILEAYAGVYSGGWPSIDDLRLVGQVNTDVVGDAAPYNLGLSRLIVGCQGTTGAANPHGVDVYRLRIYDLGVT